MSDINASPLVWVLEGNLNALRRAQFMPLNAERDRLLTATHEMTPNMVLPGSRCAQQEAVAVEADATVECLLRAVPAAVPGVAFLSGGQSAELASARLNAMNARFQSRLPWALSFSFSRAIQQPALEIWRGEDARTLAAQQALRHRARCNQAARLGEYDAELEHGR